MPNELQSLSQLFQSRLFRIPDYQRGYAWQQPQLRDFWDDIINLQQDRYHYTGLLSLKNLKETETKAWGDDLWMLQKGFKACHVVDGQQRLTTFVILLNEIISFVRGLAENSGVREEDIVLGYDKLPDIVAKYICQRRPPQNQIITYLFGYEVDNPSAAYLRHKVFGEPHAGTIKKTYYTKNLNYAKGFFRDNLSALFEQEGMAGISSLYAKITLRLMFNIHEIDDEYDVFVAFETVNNRGKKLTNLELLKNRLIYLTTLYDREAFDDADKSNLRKRINETWKEVYHQLGRNEHAPLSDDEYLRAHWIIYYPYTRTRGDDYIHFLLNKFAAKNIFEKQALVSAEQPLLPAPDDDFDDDETPEESEPTVTEVAKLAPVEIANYVNSLKGMAEYWHASYFPTHSELLTPQERKWVDKLNRIGIGYFRPLVAVIISKKDLTPEERVRAFQAIERFIFVCFRLGNYNATFRSSEYYRAARSLNRNEKALADVVEDIHQTTQDNLPFAIPNFVTETEKRFSAGGGYYLWRPLRYFLFEYETTLAEDYNIDRIGSWELFAKTEKDKVTIEHILPQTPSKHYWRNMYRQYSDGEVSLLTGALGNLLPLSHSMNAALQNDSFPDKKTTGKRGKRGYENGSHSEIEVSKNADWTAQHIHARSEALLAYMESRWALHFIGDQKERLIHVNFAMDERAVPAEIPAPSAGGQARGLAPLAQQQQAFWTNFVAHCQAMGRVELAGGKIRADNWYDLPFATSDLRLYYTVTYSKRASLVVHTASLDVFGRLLGKREAIERHFGGALEWHTSRKESREKRVVLKREADVFRADRQPPLFDWMVDTLDALVGALVAVGELEWGH